MLFRRLAEHQDVVQVHKHKLANARPKDVMRHSLKGCRCISQAKAQHLEFTMPKEVEKAVFGTSSGDIRMLLIATGQIQ